MTKINIKALGKVGVLMGGNSTEREISLISGDAVLGSLLKSGVDAYGIDVGDDLLAELSRLKIDRVFIILHGRNGEDGKVQAAMEKIQMPYTGSGISASSLAMDKIRCKQVWLECGLNTPEFVSLNDESDWNQVIKSLGTSFVKPVKEGSSIGIGKVRTAEELEKAYRHARQYDSEVIAETWVDGPEYTVAILGDNALPVIELRTKHEFYDYSAKYEDDETQYLCPCDLSEDKTKEIQALSKNAYDKAGCDGWGRVDLMQDAEGNFWLLEINTIPGMTNHSLVPMAAREAGIDFDDLVLQILLNSTVAKGEV